MHFNGGNPIPQSYEIVEMPFLFFFLSLILQILPIANMVGQAAKLCLKFLLPTVGRLLLVKTSITQSGGKGVAEMHPPQSTLKNLKQGEEI